ncbi:AraC family transcriptional regulator [Devosia rhodophyticola]|uniref:AraC family transcriptional regulator n=1 Tax=Devosia rhodophyticola TaxID=3026423 RepID=A0ABY7YXN7_9HYPH|nr:AraC family transcriptional regulator [Devosia rhodophyticola]WDR05937.1 AraC family transcriptional regulator [Devosia rhodophyticola]
MKPFLERVSVEDGTSWTLFDRQLADGIPFQWHHHPEFELTLTLNSSGQRFIGDHIDRYDDGDLVLIAPYLPHTWHSLSRLDPHRPHRALVIWFDKLWAERLTGNYAELGGTALLLQRASTGLMFSRPISQAVRPRIEALFDLPPFERFLALLGILGTLSLDGGSRPLATSGPEVVGPSAERTRLDRVLDYIHRNFAGKLSIAGLADIAALSPSGLHRSFRRQTNQSISQYLIRLRIGRACALLSSGTVPIGTIAGEVGYDSLANFNRQFKALKGLTPSQYRQNFQATR